MRGLHLIFFLFIFNINFAQNLTFPKADTLTYNAYLKNDFKTIREVGNKAFKNKIDFYFLRYRMGVACFEMKNYMEAAKHFEKAYNFDDSEAQLKEYLYFSYLYGGQKERAGILASGFSDEEKAKIKYKPSVIESIGLSAGILKTNNYTANFKNKDFTSPFPYGQATIYNNVHYENLTINLRISPEFRWTNYGSFASNNYFAVVQNNYPVAKTLTTEDKTEYYQLNSLLNYSNKSWNFGVGAGAYYSTYYSYYTDIANPDSGLLKNKFMKTNYSGSVSVSKNFQYFTPKLEASYSNLSEKKNFSSELGIYVYPLGNLNLYLNSKVAFLKNETDKNLILSQLIGCKIVSKLWIDVFGSYGNHENLIADNGLSVFYTPNKINWYSGTNFNFYFKKFDFSLGYVLQQREGNYQIYSDPQTFINKTYTFSYNLINTKITWKF